MLNRFANIFWHYFAGPLIGFNQKLWPQEKTYSLYMQALAVMLYLVQLGMLLFASLPMLTRIGLSLILFSPQWVYIWPLPGPVFEFRGYGMAAGVSLILAGLLQSHPEFLVPLCLFWAWRSYVRRQYLTEPLRFWERAQEESQHGS